MAEKTAIEHPQDDLSSPERAEESSPASRRLIWKIDLHILPMVTILYLLSFLDRSNVANARIEGLVTDVHMTGKNSTVRCNRADS